MPSGKFKVKRIAGGVLVSHCAPDPTTANRVNEDSLAIIERGDSAVIVVADGAGGHPRGEDASAAAVEAIKNACAGKRAEQLRSAILDGFEAANKAVLDIQGSATTLVVVEVSRSFARVFHAGDSTAWVIGQRGKIHFETVRHSAEGHALESGLFSEEELSDRSDLHVLTNLLGMPDMRVSVSLPVPLRSRDTVVVATDGISDNLNIDELIGHVRTGAIEESFASVVNQSTARMQGQLEGPTKPDDYTLVMFRPGGR